ncbi:C-type lectin like IEV/EEV membrane glycoprotein [Eptesipox virus]|uniref:C-type lectin like IEV/EEV membrane glycoprotein n=1 Tax=Eptesipox virus TaxID=1329402 RepID=A0A220T6K0_9POXV|nr:C-type lectin like IEV/EEV membrane glycoprotein [Eptesipox virus]ASK51332.1 C-type lectin like IEV/EEV membrane glycoprotein [Eptesipox virus]WAH71090.1 C-type lectin like IEV/EEV membrane glycoprotein [Eptesipox virus]
MVAFNRQTLEKIKKMSTPAAIFMIISTIVSGIGTMLQYKNELFPNACDKGWMSYDNFCYYDTRMQLSAISALTVCATYSAKLPRINSRHLKVMSLTFNDDFWIGIKNKENNLVDVNSNKTINKESNELVKQIKVDNNKLCYIYKNNKLEPTKCEEVKKTLCVKRFY